MFVSSQLFFVVVFFRCFSALQPSISISTRLLNSFYKNFPLKKFVRSVSFDKVSLTTHRSKGTFHFTNYMVRNILLSKLLYEVLLTTQFKKLIHASISV